MQLFPLILASARNENIEKTHFFHLANLMTQLIAAFDVPLGELHYLPCSNLKTNADKPHD